MLKLKLQYFGHMIHRVDSWEKSLTLEKSKGKRWRGAAEYGITNLMHMNLSKLQEMVKDQEPGMLQPMDLATKSWI